MEILKPEDGYKWGNIGFKDGATWITIDEANRILLKRAKLSYYNQDKSLNSFFFEKQKDSTHVRLLFCEELPKPKCKHTRALTHNEEVKKLDMAFPPPPFIHCDQCGEPLR